jgi:predicted oxidoreductase
LFDLADVYPVKGDDAGDAATLFGQALALTPGLRENITIVAKMDIIFPSAIDTTTEHIDSTLNWYLDVLNTDYVDVLLLHYSNSLMNADAVASLFNDYRTAGKVKFFGVSNHYPSKFDLLQSRLDKYGINLVTNEMEISVWNPSYLNYDSPLVDHAYQHGIRPLAWSSMGGDPIGGVNRLFTKKGTRQLRINHALKNVADELGLDSDDTNTVAMLFLLSHPAGMIPLVGTTKTSRLDQMLQAFDYVGKMTNDQWWSIAGAGGVCPLGDSQCNYEEYMAIPVVVEKIVEEIIGE